MAEYTLREHESDDVERIRELVESSMTTSYALSPREIGSILESDYLDETLLNPHEDAVVIVAELDGVVVGTASATFGEEAAVQWLHVDPERRGQGIGTALFERLTEEFEEHGVETKRAMVLSANTNAGAFFERFGYGKVDERQREIGEEDLVEYVFEEGAEGEEDDDEADEASAGNESVPDYPDSVSGDDGEELYLGDEDDLVPGSEGHFVASYTESDHSERYGYYCLNCESSDVSMDSMERIRCNECGNTHNPDEDYDSSYL